MGGAAEFSAILRVFFPGKPREHLNALKAMLLPSTRQAYETHLQPFEMSPQLDHHKEKRSVFSPSRSIAEEPVEPSETTMRHASRNGSMEVSRNGSMEVRTKTSFITGDETSILDTDSEGGPLRTLNVGELLHVQMLRGCVMDTPEQLLRKLTSDCSPFVTELMRQHLVECFMFLDRLRKAFRAVQLRFTPGSAEKEAAVASDVGASSTASHSVHLVTAKQAEAALIAADSKLTDTQLQVHLLRGFGRQLPKFVLPATQENEVGDAASSEHRSTVRPTGRAAEGARYQQAMEILKARRVLKERAEQLHSENVKVETDIFIRRLASSGVARGALVWKPDIGIEDVTKASGLQTVRSDTASGCLEDFVSAGDDHSRLAAPRSEQVDFAAKYTSQAAAGREVHELSIGYAPLALSYWLAYSPLA